MKRAPLRSKPKTFEPKQRLTSKLPGSPRADRAGATLRRDDGKARLVVAVPKREPIRSEALVKAYRSIPCQYELDGGRLCLDHRTCCNHSNWSIHGKGRGQKADDNRGASGCDYHHRELDQGKSWTADERKQLWWAAHVRTVLALIDCGLWPAGVPVPDIDNNPFRETP